VTGSELDAINARETDLIQAGDRELCDRAGDLREQALAGALLAAPPPPGPI
jgi:hypothetical protein